jgi:CDP-6-deoxy-D-xylo-4-hexulose-3-dehydrase
LWPIVQSNLKPVFVDINPNTLNIDEHQLERKITHKTKAILLVNVLGNSCDMNKIMKIKKKYNLILIEDNCESLGSKYKNKYLGTYGDFSSFSFYSSHQISSGEGGMICCKDKNDYNIIKSLRSHGWSRGTSFENEVYKKNKFLDKRFIFFNSGYNLRPTEVSAAIGHNQFKRMDKLIKIRNFNRKKIINSLLNNSYLKNKIDFYYENKFVNPSWFGLSIKILIKNFNKKKIIKKLENNGIETRPIISGNFADQPAAKLYGISLNQKFPNTDKVYNSSFFIGLPTKQINNNFLKKIVSAFEKSFR